MPISPGNLKSLTRLAVTEGWDTFVIPGQSNASGRGKTKDPDLDGTNSLVYQFKRNGTRVLAEDPLDHPDGGAPADATSMPFHFAKTYAARTGRKVLLIPVAYGGTRVDVGWAPPSGTQYVFALARVAAAKIVTPGMRLKGIIWHQGENNAEAGTSTADMKTYMEATFDAMRTAFSVPDLPVIVGGMCPEWYTGNAAREAVQTALEEFPAGYSNSAYASSDGLTGNSGDLVHFDAASCRTLGARYDAAYVGLVGI